MVWPLSPFAPAVPLAVLHMRDRWWFPPRGVDVEGWIRACREVAPEEAGAMDSDLAQYRRGGRPLPNEWGATLRRADGPFTIPPGTSGSPHWSRDYNLVRETFGDLRPSEPIPTTR